ncbi:MAG TPA: SH3 domain-containing protein, partial [Candidatus Limnocylindrales bacterium]
MLSKLEPRAARHAADGGLTDRGRAVRARLALSLVAAAFVLALTDGIALGTSTYAALCDSVNLRTGASTTYPIKKAIAAGTQVTVVATVSGGSYSTTCLGKTTSGSSWYRISAIGSRTVSSLYGITYVYGASSLFKVVANPTAAPTASPTKSPSPSAAASPSSGPASTADPSTSPDPSASVGPSGSPDPSGSPSPSPTPSVPPGFTVLDPTVELYGRGYGHGVGLSQYGAYGRAAAGQTYQTILAHYYLGTTLGPSSSTQVRVLVLSGFAASSTNPLKLYGLGGTWTFDGISTTFPADALARLVPTVSGTTVTWKLVVTSSAGATLYSGATTGNLRMRPAATATVLRLYSK